MSEPNQLSVRLRKCKSITQSTEFWELTISTEGITMKKKSLSTLESLELPAKVKKLQ
jgi:hypothetical protein